MPFDLEDEADEEEDGDGAGWVNDVVDNDATDSEDG